MALVGLLISFQNCGQFQTLSSNNSIQNVAGYPWPKIYGQGGAYFLSSAQNVNDMADQGMLLHVAKASGAVHDALVARNGKIIDLTIANLLQNTLCPNPTTTACSFSAANEQTFLNAVSQYLNTAASDPAIAGYWVLDDYFGIDVRSTLTKVHQLIATSNAANGLSRPAVCGFSTNLEFDVATKGHNAAAVAASVTPTLSNFTTAGCDFVTLYAYAPSTDVTMTADRVDWSMSTLLPQVFSILQSEGWDISQQPLIAMPQTFDMPVSSNGYYVLPSYQNVLTQATAFCNAGATAYIPFAWDTSASGDPTLANSKEPANNATLKQAAIDSFHACQKIWFKN